MEAQHYSTINGGIKCHLCPHECTLAEGRTGICRVRQNVEGKLQSLNYGVVSSMALDPIEKKPLYHFHPASFVLSVGSLGCNFRCLFCQNHTIAQAVEFDFNRYGGRVNPEAIVKKAKEAKQQHSIGVAYTYNEPTVWFEYMVDVARQIKEQGMLNVMVTNGYIQPKPLAELLPLIDAFNIDLKGYSNEFYRRMLGGTLKPVEQALQAVSKAGRHLEISYLVIPTENDNRRQFRKTCEWIRDNLDRSTVLHVNRYFPQHLLNLPPTTLTTMIDLYNTAKEVLPFVYLGNTGLPEYNNSYCGSCGKLLVERRGFNTELVGLNGSGCCSACGAKAW